MPILDNTKFSGEVVFLGVVNSRCDKLSSDPLLKADLKFEGMVGESHGGSTRISCARVRNLYPKPRTIRNFRQLSILSAEEIAQIGARIGTNLRPEWFGANIVMEGLPNLSDIPPASRLVFDGGASIMLDMENAPCKFTAEEIAHHTGIPAPKVLSALKHLRGLVGCIEAEGEIAIGERAKLFIPKSRPYPSQ